MKINRAKNYFRIIFSIMIFFITITTISCNFIPQPPIEADNDSPSILSDPDKTAYVGTKYQYIVDAYDAEGDTLFYSLNIAPQGMEIDSSTGILTWTPSLSQLGEHQVEIKVSDGNLFETQSFKITVNQENETEEMTQLFFDPLSLDTSLGSTIEIDVKVENVFRLKGASITFAFDANQLQYDSVADRAFIPDAIILEQKIDNLKGEVIIDIAGLGINSYASGSGTLFTVTFNTTSSGNATLTFNTSELRDDQNHQIDHNIGSACKIYIN